jgi:hypothetical protein
MQSAGFGKRATEPMEDDRQSSGCALYFFVFMSRSPDRCVRCLKPVPGHAAECPHCQAKVVSQMAIGQILVEEGLLRPRQLEEALELQRSTSRRLGNILTEKGYLSEREFAATLARQLDIPFFDLEEYFIDPAVVGVIPEHLCERYRLIPIMKTGEKLLVAMSDPLNQDALADIEMLTGLSIKIVVATPSDVNGALAQAFDALAVRDELTQRVLAPPPGPAPERRPHLRKIR